MALIPYLSFGGNCRDAFSYYHTVFGGELEVMGFDQLPEGADAPPNADNMVMHARLVWSEHDVLLGSDNPFDFDGVRGALVNYTTDAPDEARRVFDAMADGGAVMMPFAATFFSPGFGMVTDRFGTPWMVNTIRT